MSTRSTISIKEKEFSTIYCHWDGYLSYNGEMLLNHYNSHDKAKELLEMGNISSLNSTIEESIFYHRDRNEDKKEPSSFKTIKEILESYLTCEYHYVFDVKKNGWYYYQNGKLLKLTQKAIDKIK